MRARDGHDSGQGGTLNEPLRARGWRKVALAAWPRPHDPTTYGVLELDATPALRYLDALRENHGAAVTMLALVVKALAHALAEEPSATRIWRWGGLCSRESTDVFVHVDREGRDLSGFKLENVPRKPLLALVSEISDRSGAVRKASSPERLRRSTAVTDALPGFLMPLALRIQDLIAHDWGWDVPALGIFRDPFGAALVTNVGSLGLDLAFPPLPPIGRASIVVALGRVRSKPWVVDGEVQARPVLTLGVTMDHRMLDGAQASRLARSFAAALEDPVGAFGPDGEGGESL